MNLVLFLGAGFSAPFGLPTMNQFLEEVARSDRITGEDKEFVGKLVLEARRANSILESSPTNLEDILSFAVMGDRLNFGSAPDELMAPKVRHIIHRIYSTLKDPRQYWRSIKVFESFLGLEIDEIHRHNHSINIITTNYDLIIDSMLCRTIHNAMFPFEYKNMSKGTDRSMYANQTIPLLKLHGSINWFVPKDNGKLEIDDRLVRYRSDISDTFPAPYLDGYKYEGEPLIVPPTFLKPDLPKELLQTWASASESLRDAELVVFIGYSFPPSDIEMKYFLAKSLADNSKLRKIKIYDMKAEQVVGRLKDPNSGFGSHFRDFLDPQNGEFSWHSIKSNLFN